MTVDLLDRTSSEPATSSPAPRASTELPELLGRDVRFGAAVYGMFFVITLYLQQVLGYSPLRAGFAWLALSVTALVTSNHSW